jgi:hypothetical protein
MVVSNSDSSTFTSRRSVQLLLLVRSSLPVQVRSRCLDALCNLTCFSVHPQVLEEFGLKFVQEDVHDLSGMCMCVQTCVLYIPTPPA